MALSNINFIIIFLLFHYLCGDLLESRRFTHFYFLQRLKHHLHALSNLVFFIFQPFRVNALIYLVKLQALLILIKLWVLDNLIIESITHFIQMFVVLATDSFHQFSTSRIRPHAKHLNTRFTIFSANTSLRSIPLESLGPP